MPSTDLCGEPILILSLGNVKILKSLLDDPVTSDQDRLIRKITVFLNEPQCLEWERKHETD